METSVSIIICTRDHAENLAGTLNRLSEIDVPKNFSVELIVVDNGSTDRTPEVVRNCWIPRMEVRLLFEPHPGKALADNVGIAAAKGDILMFTDDDILMPREWIEKMCRPILDGDADAVSGAIEIPQRLLCPWMNAYHRGWLGSTENFDRENIGNLVCGNMACSRKVFTLVPRFDPELGIGRLGYHEEALFTWQLKLAGFRVRYLPGIAVEHHFPARRITREMMLDTARRAGKSSAYLAHHWEHRNIRHPWGKLLKGWLRLVWWRLRKFGFQPPREGSPQWEMELLMGIWYYRHYLVERKRPRHYKQFGFKKELV